MSTSRPLRSITPSSDDNTICEEPENSSPDVLVVEEQNAANQSSRDSASTADTTIKHPPHPSQDPRPVALSPHIIVVYNTSTQCQTAWGRVGVAKIGYHQFARMVFDAFVLHPSCAPKWEFSPFVKSKRAIFMEAYNFLRADFVARVILKPQWAGHASDGSVEESVSLQPVGWQEMIQSIVKIQVDYQPPEVYPGKAELVKILGKTPQAELAG